MGRVVYEIVSALVFWSIGAQTVVSSTTALYIRCVIVVRLGLHCDFSSLVLDPFLQFQQPGLAVNRQQKSKLR